MHMACWGANEQNIVDVDCVWRIKRESKGHLEGIQKRANKQGLNPVAKRVENAVYKAELQKDWFSSRMQQMNSERNLRQGDPLGSYCDCQK